jgi:hypothetical protein
LATKTRGRNLPSVRRVRSQDDRKLGGDFLTLSKTGEHFTGYALFVPDPEMSDDDNPGYYEYFEHYTPQTGYVPCAGTDCPFCKTGDRPSTKAKTVWLVTHEGSKELEEPTKKIFNLNWSMIQQFADDLSEGDPILGMSYRIKRLDDRGKYSIRVKSDKLTKKDVQAELKEMPDLEQITTSKLRKALEEMDADDLLDDDAGDEEEEQPRARRGKASENGKAPAARKGKAKDAEPEEDEEPRSFEEEEFEITKVVKKDNAVMAENDNLGEIKLFLPAGEIEVADFSKGDIVNVSAEMDEDDDWIVSEMEQAGAEEPEEEEEAEGGADLPDNIEREEFTVVAVNDGDETLDIENDEYGQFTLYFLDEGDASDVDFDDYKEGQKVIVTAVKDPDGDMVADEHVPEPKKERKASGGKGKAKAKPAARSGGKRR